MAWGFSMPAWISLFRTLARVSRHPELSESWHLNILLPPSLPPPGPGSLGRSVPNHVIVLGSNFMPLLPCLPSCTNPSSNKPLSPNLIQTRPSPVQYFQGLSLHLPSASLLFSTNVSALLLILMSSLSFCWVTPWNFFSCHLLHSLSSLSRPPPRSLYD